MTLSLLPGLAWRRDARPLGAVLPPEEPCPEASRIPLLPMFVDGWLPRVLQQHEAPVQPLRVRGPADLYLSWWQELGWQCEPAARPRSRARP